MFLYNLTVKDATLIHKSLVGNFTSAKRESLVLSRGCSIELNSIGGSGEISLVLKYEGFGVVTCMEKMKDSKGKRDLLLLCSEAGKISLLSFKGYCPNVLICFMMDECASKRFIPGKFLSVDNKYKAIMVSSLEKQRVFSFFSQNSAGILSVPLYCHRDNSLIFDSVSLETDQDFSVFATLEANYSEKSMKLCMYQVTYTEVTVKEFPTDDSSHKLIPSENGVFICQDQHIVYHPLSKQTHCKSIYPCRHDTTGTFIISHTKLHGDTVLIQSEYGDLFKVSVLFSKNNILTVQYLGTIPPCNSLNFIAPEHLFAASEYGASVIYKILNCHTEGALANSH